MAKNFFISIHRSVGLICSIILLGICFSGCLYVYENELKTWFRKELIQLTEVSNAKISFSKSFDVLIKNTDGILFGKTITTYRDSLRAWDMAHFVGVPKEKHGFSYLSTIQTYERVYVNPYNGIITGRINEKYDYFNLVLRFHRNLLLHPDIGKPLVGYSVVAFLILMVSGLLLWWPKRWKGKAVKAAITIKTKSSWRKRFYDWHKVSGFYVLPLAIIIAISGLFYAFKPIRAAYIWSLTGKTKIASLTAPNNPTLSSFDGVDWNWLIENSFADAWGKYPNAWRISFRMPDSNQSILRATVNLDEQTNYKRAYLYYDVQNGELVHSSSYKDRVGGEALVAMNYDLHTGSIFGKLSKPIYLFATLILALLPASGLIIWWQRVFQKKGEKNSNKKMSVVAKIRENKVA